jgi:hypothetical protein
VRPADVQRAGGWLSGIAAGIVVQLRDLPARPVVAEDEDCPTADIVMRAEDERERAAPVIMVARQAMGAR